MRFRALFFFLLLFASLPSQARTMTDHIGRRVALPDKPQRIVSLAPSLTETLFAVGLGDRVAGVTDYCDYPDEAKTRPKVGGIINPSVEAIVALQPDLVLIAKETNRRDTLEKLEQLKIAAFVLNAERLDDVFRLVRDVAAAGGVEKRGEELARELERRSSAVEKALHGEAPARVFMMISLQPVVTVGHGTFIDDLLRRSGAESVSAGSSQAWPHYSIEEVLRADPEYVLIPQAPGFAPTRDELMRMPAWSELKAVQEDRIIYVPAAVERPGPRLIDMQELIARSLHPRIFKK